MRVERELFESSLRSARSVLELLGHPPHEARQSAMRFRQHNLALFEQLYPHHKDRAKVIAVVKQGRAQLEEQMAKEREQLAHKRPAAWHDEAGDAADGGKTAEKA
jgi:glutathione-regulated potassium-efflux system ancillary protein KefC